MAEGDHIFSDVILDILSKHFGDEGEKIFAESPLIKYLNIKTRAANKGSKSRASFANIYALYVLIEDYIRKGYLKREDYRDYEGAKFSTLFKRQRQLPFGDKLQNHALNSRLKEEFKKYFPLIDSLPILRDSSTNHYWINERFLKTIHKGTTYNIAQSIIDIIDAYVVARKDSFMAFVTQCEGIKALLSKDKAQVIEFIKELLNPKTDARIFEIVSFSILKVYYSKIVIYWGYDKISLTEEPLALYKTGRTNANDGGIDFVMKPLGRFFQVTETIDMTKYFLDIDKVQKFPITFVIKTQAKKEVIRRRIQEQAEQCYPVKKIVERYMTCIEEIINCLDLLEYLDIVINLGKLGQVMDEIILQSRIEFNMDKELAEIKANV